VDHARCVITFGGSRRSIRDSLTSLADWAIENLRLSDHTGVHPRFGVLDVVPVIPYREEESVAHELAVEFGEWITTSLGVPVHYYERAHPDRRSLPNLRRFLRNNPHDAHPTAGVVCIGVRDPLVAFNVNFRGDLVSARDVARSARTQDIRALGFQLASRGLVQVSMNLITPDRVGPKFAFDRVLSLARERGLEIVDCEVVGLVPHPILEQLEGLPLRKPVRSIEQALAEKGLS
jgi:glutamate formiminotransferase